MYFNSKQITTFVKTKRNKMKEKLFNSWQPKKLRVPRKVKKAIKKRYQRMTGFKGKTIIIGYYTIFGRTNYIIEPLNSIKRNN